MAGWPLGHQAGEAHMKPLGRRIVVERDPTLEQYGSLVIPETARTKPQAGRVIAVGAEVDTVRMGDRVLFGRHSMIEVDGVGLVLWEKDVMGVLE